MQSTTEIIRAEFEAWAKTQPGDDMDLGAQRFGASLLYNDRQTQAAWVGYLAAACKALEGEQEPVASPTEGAAQRVGEPTEPSELNRKIEREFYKVYPDSPKGDKHIFTEGARYGYFVLAGAPLPQSLEGEARDAALRMARAHIRWNSFGECRDDGWESAPPTAAEVVAAIDAAIAQQSASEGGGHG